MKNADIRKIEYTSNGEMIQFLPSSDARFRFAVTSLIRITIVVVLGYWTYPALEAYFVAGEITGAAKLLETLELSDAWIRRIMIGWCIVLGWWALGSVFELLKMLLQGDRFLLRGDGFTVRRTSILSREFQFKSYDPLELRLRPLDGALEAKQNQRSTILTDGGTTEDRKWLLNLLLQRYRFPAATGGTSTIEHVATYRVEKRADQSVLISSSAGSRVGCATLATVACVGLIVFAIRLFAQGSTAGIIPLMFCIALGYGAMIALNRRTVEASRGKLIVRWDSPAGKILSRFVSSKSAVLQHQFGQGEFQRDSGTFSLKTVSGRKKEPSYHIVLRQKVPENLLIPTTELEEEEEEKLEEELEGDEIEEFEGEEKEELDLVQEDFVMDFTGTTSRPAAEYVLQLLSDTTGFQSVRYLNP